MVDCGMMNETEAPNPTRSIQPSDDPALVVEYVHLEGAPLQEAIARLPRRQAMMIMALVESPGSDRATIARSLSIPPSMAARWASTTSPTAFRACWYSVMAQGREAIPAMALATLQAHSLTAASRICELSGEELADDPRRLQQQGIARSVVLKAAGVLSDTPVVAVSVEAVLVASAQRRRADDDGDGRGYG